MTEQQPEPLSNEQRALQWLEGSGGLALRRESPRSYAELAAAAMDEQVCLEIL